jgi:3'-phosphoadenosine 5'-phosphosulfate sulfotransferase
MVVGKFLLNQRKRGIVTFEENLVSRLRKRAEIRRSIQTRKSVQEGKPDRISDLLEEAAAEIELLWGKRNEEVKTPD